jgi:hypothetical protein
MHYEIEQWPEMPGDGGEGDVIILSDLWPEGDWERQKSWDEGWGWFEGNVLPGDTITVRSPMPGQRSDDYSPKLSRRS